LSAGTAAEIDTPGSATTAAAAAIEVIASRRFNNFSCCHATDCQMT
jgi:hypothetical protein